MDAFRQPPSAPRRTCPHAAPGGTAPGGKRALRIAAWAALAAVLALGFWGYTQPGMKLNWETLAALCGFGL
ncbi:hypothetical protein V8Z80_15040 [Orrella sp. JC864]|uniref:hypothetical protein n=1 Tax=Orrella sp. JC864 TaxID=3120298 RepID=UPI00300983CF